jgi:DNA repair protein RadC
MDQYKIDVLRFSDILSKHTGISKTKIDEFIKNNPVNNIFEHPGSICSTTTQLNKIQELKELHSLYNNLKLEDQERYSITSSHKAVEYFKNYFADVKDKELFVCAFLDNQNNIISTKVMSEGTVNEAPVYPREIVKEAILNDANAVILSHNHPGGSISPSIADKDVTMKIVEALKTVNIKTIDHIIVGNDKACSFAERGLMSENNISNSIREEYKNEYPAIKHISEKTTKTIDDLNNSKGKHLSIEEIKDMYKAAGKKLEGNYSKSDMEDFKVLKEVVDDLKQAQLTEKQDLAKQKVQDQIHSKSIDLVQ